MKAFIDRDVPMVARWINLKAAQALYEAMKESGKYPRLDEQGLA
jgi:hypothetical protein